jgi:hypothetical protein
VGVFDFQKHPLLAVHWRILVPAHFGKLRFKANCVVSRGSSTSFARINHPSLSKGRHQLLGDSELIAPRKQWS